MEKTEVYIQKEVDLKSPVLIEGLPGLGLVGKLAADHMIKEIKAEKFAELYSPEFPPQVVIQPDGTVRMMKDEFYFWKAEEKSQKDLLIIVGDHQGINPQSHYELAGKVLDLAGNYGTKTIFTLGGYGVGRLSKEPKVFGAVSHKPLIREFRKHGVVFERVGGSIIGAAGLLLGLGALRGMRGICLMGETHGNYVDPRAAKSILTVLAKALSLKIDLSELDKRAKETEEMIERLETVQKTQQQQMPPVGPQAETFPYIR